MSGVVTIACGIFQAELPRMASLLPGQDLVILDSMLHMRPQALQEHIDRQLKRRASSQALFIYGDCTPRIVELSRHPGFAKTQGANCCEILLGRADYRRLRHQGAFFFLPEWARRWRDVFQKELGFAQIQDAGEMLRETHARFVYLDTGVTPVPVETLREIERELGLSLDILPVGLDHLAHAITAAREALHG